MKGAVGDQGGQRRIDALLNWPNSEKLKLRKQIVVLKKCAVTQKMLHAINRLLPTGIMLNLNDLRHKVHHRSMSHRVGVAKLMKWHPGVRLHGERVWVVANLAK